MIVARRARSVQRSVHERSPRPRHSRSPRPEGLHPPMSEQPDSPPVPQWDVADRMRKALREADITVGEMAAYLDVARNTVSTWINGRINPSRQTLRLWALRTGVSFEWLAGSAAEPRHPSPGGGVSAGQPRVMIPCSWQPANGKYSVISLGFKRVLLPTPLAA